MTSLGKLETILKMGNEPFICNNDNLSFTLLDFWKWSASNVLSNAMRGVLAEFIVATAVGMDITKPREEWKPYDLEAPGNIKLEIKSAAYLQTWFQKKLSGISFGIRPTFNWDESTNVYDKEKKRQANVYVFCLLHHNDKATVDPLNLNQWEFYVLPTETINEYPGSPNFISLKNLKKLTTAVNYNDLSNTINKAVKNSKNQSV